MAGIDSFLLNWFFSPNSKMAIQFSTLGGNLQLPNSDTNLPQGPTSFPFLDYTNGLNGAETELYQMRNQITDFPVESRTNISDNIIVRPKSIRISGLLTSIIAIPIIGPLQTSFLNFNQLGRAVQFLINAADSKQLFTLTTGLLFGQSIFKIKNVAIESLDIPRDNIYGKSTIKFNIVFKEVFVTDTAPKNTTTSSTAALDPNIGGPNG